MRARWYTLVVGVWLAGGRAAAIDLGAPNAEPLRLEVTETAMATYHANNRDPFPENDDYGEWIDRLDLQLTWQRLGVGMRLDSAAYVAPPSPAYLASNAVAPDAQAQNCDLATETLAACYDRKLSEYQRALLNRYLTVVYPSKLFVRYGGPTAEATLGDFYAQFGRGLTLAVRKVDEFAYDTTIRGAKIEWSRRVGSGRMGATLLAGYANPVRVDEISGRTLTAPPRWWFPGMPGFDPSASYVPAASETYRPDGIAGARFEGGTDRILFGAYGSLLARGGLEELVLPDDLQTVGFRDAHPGRQGKFVETASASLSLPRIGESAAYLEFAGQRVTPASSLTGPAPEGLAAVNGYALYASLSAGRDRLIGLIEMRHTRRFAPLMANVDTSRAPEFFGLQYSAPPTTEPITTDTEFNLFAYCTTGGRARVDARLSGRVSLYGSLGVYRTWSERFGACDATGGGLVDADRNDVWDPFVGVVLTTNQARSRANVWSGIRVDRMPAPAPTASGTQSTEFYREAYVRYDALHTIDASWALQVQGVHRAPAEPPTDRLPWYQGENYVAVHWSSTVIAAFGYEYTTRYGTTLNYFNGTIFWRLPRRWLSQDSSLRLFAGQQRGGLRCVNGVCKVFPDLAGVRTELVLRF